jgi:glycosyltransferase involved in cell wall biosynthesis
MMHSTIYLTFDGLTDPLGQSQILPYLVKLAERGHDLTIISSEKPENYNRFKGKIEEIIKGHIKWVPIEYSNKYPIVSQFFTLSRLKKETIKIILKKGSPVIHCRSYMTALIGLEVANKYSLKWIFDMRGFWADERVEGKLWNLKNPLYRIIYFFFKKKEAEFFTNSSAIVSLTENAKQEILSRENLIFSANAITVIPCCTDTALFTSSNSEKFSSFTISYLGSLGTWYLLDEMLLFFKNLMKIKHDAQFLFVTHENPKVIIKRAEINGIDITRLIIKPAQREEIPNLISRTHLSIFFIKPVFSKRASSPTKLGEILSLGVPIITNKGVGDVDTIIGSTGTGILINDFTEEEYNLAISKIDALLKIPVDKIRNAAIENFSLEKGVDAYDEIYKQLHRKVK